jgi:hypothetical protein
MNMKKPTRKLLRGVPKPTKALLPIRKLTFDTAIFTKRFTARAKSLDWAGNGGLPTKMLMPFVLSRLSKQNGMGKIFKAENRPRRIMVSVLTDASIGKSGYDMMVNLCHRAHLTKPQAELIVAELGSFAKRVKGLEKYAEKLSLEGTNPSLKGVHIDKRF